MGAFVAFVVAGYFRRELGAGREIQFVMSAFGWSRPAARLVVIGVRKLSHLVGYAAFSLSLLAIVGRKGRSLGRPASWSAFWALAGTACVAAGDELIQTWIPWRQGLISDALLDVAAAALAVGLATARSHGCS